ncbi:putative ribonuclease H2 subunit B, wHTH domain-containing protein [Helianthus debilis subsp. tardiflorus]
MSKSCDGGLYTATPVDPVFILLPMFDQARMKNGNDPGKFRQLDEIIYIHDYPGYRCLSTVAESSMQIVCDFKEIGSTKFFRLNDSKVLAWMLCKVQQLKQTLVKLDKNYAARSEKEICTVCETYMSARVLADVVMILGEYLADDPWCKVLCDNLRYRVALN